ncbi:hypothetical protein VTL71DRAFT_866 [Oculimacula yallundae]|uniref:Zn(2)-C6 fungal-type domain-containing protein n=1 Tax=Oculimacula yallundae TaxID=86028 RepID=A0ABR4D2Q0_9HELO
MESRKYYEILGSDAGSEQPVTRHTTGKKRRTLGPKVKSGCVTCKIRRVKCDEGKPGCMRCLKFGQLCDGYEDRRPSNIPGPKKPRPLVPNQNTYISYHQPIYQNFYQNISPAPVEHRQDDPAHESQAVQNIQPTPPDGKSKAQPLMPMQYLYRAPPRDLFHSDQERLYFQRFCEISATQLTGCLESDLWSRVVLQASETAPCIRHAVTAIGTLNLKGWRDGNLQRHQRYEVTRLEFAYHEYHCAITNMRQATLSGHIDIRTKLLACLLFACFETYHGNRDVATAQVFAGIQAIDDYNVLRSQAPALYPAIDEEIVRIFVVLEIQATTYQDRRSRELHLDRLNRGRDAVEDMPTEFTSLKEARLPLTRIVLRGIHLTMSQREVDLSLHPSIVDLWWITERPTPLPIGPNSDVMTVDPVYALQCNILSEYKRWEGAFEPLLRRARGLKGRATFHAASLLRIHYLSGVLCLAATTPHPLYYHRCYTRELTEVVDIAHQLLEDSNQSLLGDSYSLDIGVVMPLIVVGYKYRHRALRRRIIDTFGKVQRREGIWDVDVTGKVMEWVRSIEEEGLESEELEMYVPEERVATICRMDTDLVKRESVVGVMHREGGVGEFVLKETVIHW